MDRSTKERLYSRLRRDYGAVKVEDHEGTKQQLCALLSIYNNFSSFICIVSSEKLSKDPNYKIVKVTIHNEAGALNKILKGFCVSVVPILIVHFMRDQLTMPVETIL